MKFLLVMAVVAIAVWIWRQNRRESMRDEDNARRPAAPVLKPPQAMARCAHCGLHLPATDAIAGRQGSYCSASHRQAAEG